MIPYVILERVQTPLGEMTLAQRGADYSIRVATVELMNSRNHVSEVELGKLATAPVRDRQAPRVLIGGLGLGYTLRAALDHLPAKAHVDVCELVPAVVRWNREIYGALANHPLADARTHVIEGDVAHVLAKPPAPYDAILLDVDNGPDGIAQHNDGLYRARGIAAARDALSTHGVLAVWSSFESATFTKWLRDAGFGVEIERVRARGSTHVVWIATRR